MGGFAVDFREWVRIWWGFRRVNWSVIRHRLRVGAEGVKGKVQEWCSRCGSGWKCGKGGAKFCGVAHNRVNPWMPAPLPERSRVGDLQRSFLWCFAPAFGFAGELIADKEVEVRFVSTVLLCWLACIRLVVCRGRVMLSVVVLLRSVDDLP